MRLLADQNFPRLAVEALRELGHDIAWVQETAPSMKDEEVLKWSVRESRVLLTLDKDFGELAFRFGLPADCGVVLFRLPPRPQLVATTAQRLFRAEPDFRNRFVVVEATRVRERMLSHPLRRIL